jgi:hypothetical protein
MAMGDALAANAKAKLEHEGIKVDVVIPVPDTSRVAALQLAQNLGVPYREGFVFLTKPSRYGTPRFCASWRAATRDVSGTGMTTSTLCRGRNSAARTSAAS